VPGFIVSKHIAQQPFGVRLPFRNKFSRGDKGMEFFDTVSGDTAVSLLRNRGLWVSDLEQLTG
jgi:hypothetical protein